MWIYCNFRHKGNIQALALDTDIDCFFYHVNTCLTTQLKIKYFRNTEHIKIHFICIFCFVIVLHSVSHPVICALYLQTCGLPLQTLAYTCDWIHQLTKARVRHTLDSRSQAGQAGPCSSPGLKVTLGELKSEIVRVGDVASWLWAKLKFVSTIFLKIVNFFGGLQTH